MNCFWCICRWDRLAVLLWIGHYSLLMVKRYVCQSGQGKKKKRVTWAFNGANFFGLTPCFAGTPLQFHCAMAEQRRTPLKTRSPRQELWRDRFKKQCESRMKDARSAHIQQRRENQVCWPLAATVRECVTLTNNVLTHSGYNKWYNKSGTNFAERTKLHWSSKQLTSQRILRLP